MSSQGISLLPPNGGGGHLPEGDLYCEIEGIQAEVRPGDLTKGGLFVQTPTPPAPDSELQVFLRSEIGETTVQGLVVQVISCRRAASEGRAPGFGLLFIHLSRAQRLWIEHTLAAIRARHPRVRPRPKSAPQMPSAPPDRRSLTPKQRRMERERQQTLSDLKDHLSQIQQRPPWKVLGVEPNASERDSKAAYFQLSKRYHPHLYARYDSTEINQTVTDIFITTKRAYAAMRQASQPVVAPSPSPASPASPASPRTPRPSGSPPARVSEPPTRPVRNSMRTTLKPANDTRPSTVPQARRARPSNPVTRAEMETTAGIKLLAAGRFTQAKEKFNSALALVPDAETAKLWLLVCEARQLKKHERIDEAVDRYRAVLELDPNHREALEETGKRGARRRSRLLGKFFGGDDQ